MGICKPIPPFGGQVGPPANGSGPLAVCSSTMRRSLMLAVMVGCFQFEPPASRSPLKDKLAPLSEHDLESAVRSCLEKSGWKVDDVPSQHGAIQVLHAKKHDEDTSLYLY